MTTPNVRLSNGIEMPTLGLGTWKMSPGEETVHAVRAALDAGYRLIDTAALYGNEESVGEAMRVSGVPREDIFVTTKLWPTDFFHPRKAFDTSLKKLGMEYVDLYLVHWPIPLMPRGVWKELENIYDEKLARAIGISNYSIHDIEKLLSYARIVPMVNQVEFNPFVYEKGLLAYCKEKNIVLEAYSPLTHGAHLDDPRIQAVATRCGKTPAQIMIRWCIQHETVVIPKSSHPDRIKENMDVFDFDLSSEDMAALDALSS